MPMTKVKRLSRDSLAMCLRNCGRVRGRSRGSGRVVAMRCHKVFFVAENFRFRVWHWHFYPFFQ